jgi:hypothetical protein
MREFRACSMTEHPSDSGLELLQGSSTTAAKISSEFNSTQTKQIVLLRASTILSASLVLNHAGDWERCCTQV